MKVTAEKNEKVANMIFASIYPLYWNRLEKNGRTKEEFHKVLERVVKWRKFCVKKRNKSWPQQA